jgi:hypothetical protein
MTSPVSERFRLVAKEWVELDHSARLMEETKSAVLSQQMAVLGDMPVSKAELKVKASDDWHKFIQAMVDARTSANLKKVELEWIRMRFSEQQSREATERAERKL